MNDPYKVLGISADATDEDVKKAYRNLARKYHPDRYVNEPELAKSAEEKMKEINSAYEMIQNIRDGKVPYGDRYGSEGYRDAGAYQSSSSDPRYSQVRAYINSGMLDRAAETLYSFPEADRDGEWYYLMGFIEMRKGHYSDAKLYFDRACELNPDNYEFRYAKQRMERRSEDYGRGYTVSDARGCSLCDICSLMICLDCFCGRRC